MKTITITQDEFYKILEDAFISGYESPSEMQEQEVNRIYKKYFKHVNLKESITSKPPNVFDPELVKDKYKLIFD